MKRHILGVLGALACALSLVACGNNGGTGGGGTGGSGGAGGTGGAGLTKEQACDKFAGQVCDKLNTCAPFVVQFSYGDKATCVTRATLGCLSTFGLDGVSATPDNLSSCSDAYGAQACGDLFGGDPPPGCDFKGTKDDGAACSSGIQCKNGSCVLGAQSSCGKCATPAAEGASCKDVDCGTGLACDPNLKCVKRPAKGEACAAGIACAGGLTCVGGKCDTPLGEGATCMGGDCDTLKGLYCNPSTTKCEALTVAKVGEKCGYDMATKKASACSGGSSCDPSNDTCVANIPDGGACPAGGAQCETPASCNGGKCTTDPPVCK